MNYPTETEHKAMGVDGLLQLFSQSQHWSGITWSQSGFRPLKGFLNPGNFCLRNLEFRLLNLESWALKSRIRLKESGIQVPLTDWNAEPVNWGGGGTPLYRLYMYVPRQRVWFFLAVLVWNRVAILTIWSEQESWMLFTLFWPRVLI